MMRKALLLSMLLLATNGFSQPVSLESISSPKALTNYVEIIHAIAEGKDIRILFEPSHCLNADGKSVKNMSFAFGAFTPNEIIVTQDSEIKASLTHLTMNDPHYPDKVVYQHVVYNISSADNFLRVTSQVLDAENHKPLSDKVSYTCSILKNGGALIYAK